MKNTATAVEMYAAEHGGHLPESLDLLTPDYLKLEQGCVFDIFDEAGGNSLHDTYEVKTDRYGISIFCSKWDLRGNDCYQSLRDTKKAVDDYRLEKGHWPVALSEIEPRSLSKCPRHDIDFVYLPKRQFFSYYCKGKRHRMLVENHPRYDSDIGVTRDYRHTSRPEWYEFWKR